MPRKSAFTLVELLVVIAIISLLSSLVIPAVSETLQRARRTACAQKLRELYRQAMLYADNERYGSFPFAGEGEPAYRSLQIIADFMKETLRDGAPFRCPASRDEVARKDPATGRIELAPESVSYTWTARRLRPGDPATYILATDNAVRRGDGLENHRGGMNVLYADGSVEFVPVSEFGEDWIDGLPPNVVR